RDVLVVAGAIVMAIAPFTAVLIDSASFPWHGKRASEFALSGALTLFAIGLGSTFFGWLRSRARQGRVVLDDRLVVFFRGRRFESISWSEIRGFRDRSADYVELVTGDVAPRWIPPTIPTATEKARVAVLEYLDARGVARVE
ncbi:MAG: hypothetical protein ACAI25_03405, partial [Planctomycetota bacterium]